MKKFIQNIRKKWITKTIMTLLLIAIIVAAFIGINILVKKLNLSNIDVTKEKIHTLSDESVNKTNNVKTDVTMFCIGLNEYEKVFNILDQYTRINEKVKYEKIENVTDRPDLVSKYGLTEETQAIIVESGERSKVLTTTDLYTYDYNTYEEIDLTEEAITNAVMDVTIEEKPQIYFLTGHNNYEIDTYMSSLKLYLTNEANEVQNLDLLVAGAVPEGCDVLVITALKEDITAFEKEEILKYINNGGKMMILTDPLFITEPYANFNEILNVYGVSIQTNGVIFEQDADKMLADAPELIRPVVNEESEITKYLASDIGTCFIDSTKLNFIDDQQLQDNGITVENLVTAGENAFLRTNLNLTTYSKTDEDQDAGNSVLGALITKKFASAEETNNEVSEGEEQIEEVSEDAIKSQLIIFANNIFATDVQIPLSSTQQLVGIQFYNNKDLVLNSISYLANRQDTLTIRKNTSAVTYTATDLENKIIQGIIIAYPILIVVVGIVVWQVRRRKK
ncbi:MAG: GldG family protein [Clostridia bacterium]|nr:GldG family protein [Clostridia bacterium]